MMKGMKTPALLALASVLLVCTLLSAYYLYPGNDGGVTDARLQAALSAVQSPRTYEVIVETATDLSDRTINVLGLYRLDFETNRFGSYATTTLTIPTEKPANRSHAFTFINLSMANDIYVWINTNSAFLQKTIPHSGTWRHFQKDAVPTHFKDIAVSGPVLDNLALLGKDGSYLSLSGPPIERTYAGESFFVYEFTLSKEAARVVGGTLEPLMRRIGTGHVFVWVDDTSHVRMMTFSGENYSSTTTVLTVNNPVEINAPILTE